MRVLGAAATGLRRAVGTPRLVLLLWLLNVLVALPAAVVVGEAIHESIGASRVHLELRRGLDLGWLGEFQATARGLAATFGPTVVGAAALFDNLEAWWSGRLFVEHREIAAFGGVYLVLWTFLLGGVVERFARPAPAFELGRFLAAAARWFFRFLRLAALAGVLYYAVYKLARRLFPWIEHRLRDETAETTVLGWYLLAAVLLVALLCLVRVVFDYARIAMVLEDRRSALGAALRGLLFVARRPLRAFGPMVLFALLGAAALAGYAALAPGPGQATWTAVVVAFAAAQAMVVVRLVLRLGLVGGELAVFEPYSRR